MNLLFVCSRNQWRSPTAEEVYRKRDGIEARSAGTEPSARIRLSAKHIRWAEVIFVMEKKHREKMVRNFPDEMKDKNLVVLDIPDEYTFMDPELVEDIRVRVDHFLTGYESRIE